MTDQNSSVIRSRQDDDNTLTKQTTKKRPQLGYLKTAWTTHDLYNIKSDIKLLKRPSSSSSSSSNYSGDEENLISDKKETMFTIRLPPIHYHDDDDDEDEQDEILQEIIRMITLANILCLTGSLVECFVTFYTIPSWNYLKQHYQDWMPHIILPFYTLWWLFMIRVLRNKTGHLRQYLNWTQASAVVMATTLFLIHNNNSQYHMVFVALSILASFVFAFAKRILYANELKSERWRTMMARESTKLQQHVDQQTAEIRHHRLMFLATVSQEIQDVALMVITTLEQFSPASILSSNHELLSACSLAVPIASISAINTTIRQICHVSSHLQLLSKLTSQAWTTGTNVVLPDLMSLGEFDIGELLQNIGDALAGVASKLDVKFVIYHCDNTLHHTLVLGDEGAIRHALLNHLRNILECCTPGACIEVGLNVTTSTEDPHYYNITFLITHTASPAIPHASAGLLPNANLTAQLLAYIRATCTAVEEEESRQTKFEINFELQRGKKDMNSKMFLTNDSSLLKNHYANVKFANEPTLKDLTKFIETLKGLKMILHAPEQSIFAKHLTSCLANWNTDISHVPVTQNQDLDGSTSSASSVVNEAFHSDHSNATTPNLEQPQRTPSTPPVPSPAIEEEHIHSIPPAFILIDDDVATLEAKLNEFRLQPPASANMLQHHHGARRLHMKKNSSNGHSNFFHHGSTTAIIHFTSLTQYKAVRDTIQCYALLPTRDPFSMPRVVVVPKPAGPRRFLTALHTAYNNAVVEPHFSAIATSPMSPLPPALTSMLQSPSETGSPNRRRASPGDTTNYFTQRRRSDQQQDYLTAKMTPLMALGVTPTTPAAIKNEVEPEDKTKEEETPKKMTMTHFKLNKKKKKKAKPFADAVSPPIHVLIVEDNIINQAILSTWMKKHNIKFSVASNGKEAVDKWKTGGFHLILMDIQLPVMNGIEATKMIRGIEKEQRIGVLPSSREDIRMVQASTTFRSPVIIVALTASSLESDRHAALAAGCNDFLTKPVSLEWLEKKIIEWGCMQALIDFEGWRRWKRSNPLTKKQSLEEKKKVVLEETASSKKIYNSKGILLPGVNHKRKNIPLKPSKSDSDTPLLSPIKPTRSGSTKQDNRFE